MHPRTGRAEPRWHSGSAAIGGALVAKFAWSQIAARRTHQESQVLMALRAAAPHLQLPEVIATGTDPVLLVTRLVPGRPLTAGGIAALDRAGVDRVAAQLVGFLAGLHDFSVLDAVQRSAAMVVPEPQADTNALRERLGRWVRPSQRDTVLHWCDWADAVLGDPSPPQVLAHGDLHGHNQLWDMGLPALQAVVDFDISGPIEAEFDFRYLPSQASEREFLAAVVRHYRQASGRDLDLERVLAWHLRTVLGDALWRSEAGVALPGGGDPPRWVDELALRLNDAGVTAA